MIKFEKVSRFADINLELPTRKTAGSAGYDFTVAADTIIPPYNQLMAEFDEEVFLQKKDPEEALTLKEVAGIAKASGAQPSLVPTGVKAKMPNNTYLELSVRSSCPLKHWLILANGVGIIDSDYYNNPSNEGEIFFQLINLSSMPILLKKGDAIGQGIFKNYLTTDDDSTTAERMGGFGSTSV